MTRTLIPKGGNDRVMTPDDLALRIVQHFRPTGKIVEPCSGRGAFLRALSFEMRTADAAYELDDGLDFLKVGPFSCDWIVTNPPWSKLRAFLKKSMEVADNVVFLCTVNHFFLKARRRDMREAGFGIVEICEIDTPPKPWPQSGFQLGVVWLRRGWTGGTSFTSL